MFSSSIWTAHHSAMLPSCSFYFSHLQPPHCFPQCVQVCFLSPFSSVWWEALPGLLPCLCEGVLAQLELLCQSRHCSPPSSWPGLGSHPPVEQCDLAGCLCWRSCFWQKSSCTFRTASLKAACWNGRRQLLTLPSGKAQFTKDVLSSDPSWAVRVQHVFLNFSFFY